jgi:hypothetical protein
MTTPDFQKKYPKPWRLVMFKSNFSLRAANNEIVATLGVSSFHTGIPQIEWNRHVAAGLREYLPVVEATPQDDTRYGQRPNPAIQP